MDFKITATVCYMKNEKGEILLQKKSRGFGVGNWNGPGGKLEKGETLEEGVKREVFEETDLKIKTLKDMGRLEFIFEGPKSKYNMIVHIFTSGDFSGDPKDKGEGELKWFKKEDIPLDKMWDDDRYWLLDMLDGKYIKMRFYFGEDDKVYKYENIK